MSQSRPVIQTLDLQEQGDYPLVVFPPPEASERGMGVVGVTRVIADEDTLTGYRGAEIVVIFPAKSGWAVYSTKLLRLLSREDAMREVAAEAKTHMALAKELYGEDKTIGEIMQAMDTKASGTGQYL